MSGYADSSNRCQHGAQSMNSSRKQWQQHVSWSMGSARPSDVAWHCQAFLRWVEASPSFRPATSSMFSNYTRMLRPCCASCLLLLSTSTLVSCPQALVPILNSRVADKLVLYYFQVAYSMPYTGHTSLLLVLTSVTRLMLLFLSAFRMSYLLPHLHNGYAVDQAIMSEEDRVVIIRFGHDWDPTCMQMDEILASTAEQMKNFAVVYLVDIGKVPDFNTMYELYDPCTTMFFFRNKHIMVDLGTGNNNKINWAMNDKQEFIDIVETVYRGARKGRGLVVSPKDYSTKYRY